jgi:hypothetical protein
MKITKRFVSIAAAAMLFLAAAPIASGQKLGPDELESLLTNAKTADEHLRLAAHYSTLSGELASEGENHAKMAGRLQRPNLPPKVVTMNQAMVAHCKNLAKALKQASEEARRMAREHEAMAKEL